MAQTSDERLKALEAELEALKKRVDALEGTTPAAAVPVKPSAVQADCAAWSRLKMSMTQAEVRALVGEPSKMQTTPLQIVWRYPCGSAYFDANTTRFVGAER